MTTYNRDMLGMGILAIAGISFLVSIVINAFICYLLQECYKRIPPQFRKQQPGMVWLLLIPCFSIIWNFFVFPPLSKSFKAYFDSVNRTDVGDCQQSIGLGYAICCAVSLIPYLGCLTGLAALVLLIIYLIKTNELKNQIPTETGF
jgi:hypothetical protein